MQSYFETALKIYILQQLALIKKIQCDILGDAWNISATDLIISFKIYEKLFLLYILSVQTKSATDAIFLVTFYPHACEYFP